MKRLWGQVLLLVEVCATYVVVKLVDTTESRFKRWSGS